MRNQKDTKNGLSFVCPLDGNTMTLRGETLQCRYKHRFSNRDKIPVFFRSRGVDWEKNIYKYEKILSRLYKARLNANDGWWENGQHSHMHLKNQYVFGEGRKKIIRDISRKYSGSVLIDLGCGEGYVIRELLSELGSKAKSGTIYGTDPSIVALGRAKKLTGSAVTFFSADATHLPFADGSVDFIMATEVIEHIPNLRLLFLELNRVLKTGGELMLTTPNPNGLAIWIDNVGVPAALKFLRRLVGKKENTLETQKQADYDVFVDSVDLKNWLKISGFDVRQEFVEVIPESYFALLQDLRIPLIIARPITDILVVFSNLMPNCFKKYLGFTQIAYAKKKDQRGF